jgi:hypothetical protein
MKTVDAPSFSERVDRFLRWFFTASPDAVIEPLPPRGAQPRSRIVAHRTPTRLRPRHSGPVRVVAKGKQ